jgi:phage N-6-adenine-methyltransferase
MTKTEKRELLQQLATPPDFWRVVNAEFDFQIDVCASAANKKCAWYIDAEIDALAPNREWIGAPFVRWPAGGALSSGGRFTRAWCNPGFSTVLPWHEKAFAEAQKHPGAVVAVIGLPGGSQDWFHFAYHHASEIRMLRDRVQYIPPAGIEDKGNSRESWLFIYRRKLTTQPAQFVLWDWKGAS